jgi:hypothetical protein
VASPSPSPATPSLSASPSPSASSGAIAVLGGVGASPDPGDEAFGGISGLFGPEGSAGPEGPLGPFLLLSVLATAVVGGFWMLLRRRPRRDRDLDPEAAVTGSGAGAGATAGALVFAAEPLGPPPVLLPAAIIRQILVDPTDYVPDWAKRQPKPAPVESEPLETAAEEPVAVGGPVPDEVALEAAGPAAEPVAALVPPKPAKRPKSPRSTGSTPRKRSKPTA